MPVEELATPAYPPREQPSAGRLPVLTAVRRHLPLVLLPVIVLVGAAIAIGLQRTPEYESEARLNVGGLNLTSQSIEGYTAAVTQLAIAYSRSVHAQGVVEPVADELDMSVEEVLERSSGTNIQGSSVVRVRAKGGDAGSTVALADAMADSLVEYAKSLNSGRSTASELLKRFRRASRDFRRAEAALARATSGGRSTRRLETRVDLARLEVQTVGELYTRSQAGQAATELVQKLAPASRATSDRQEVMQQLVGGAALAGLLIGVGLAVARANAIARRRLPQE